MTPARPPTAYCLETGNSAGLGLFLGSRYVVRGHPCPHGWGSGALRRYRQNGRPVLQQMSIKGKRHADPKPLHHREANRIREREVLVAVGFENSYCSSFVIGRRTHHDGRARDHIPEHLSCRVSTPSRQHESVEFREAEGCCDRGKAKHGNPVRDQLA